MGKLQQRYNAKARQGSSFDHSEEQKKNDALAKSVQLESSELEYRSSHDTSNALVTEARKKKTPSQKVKEKNKKVLSKKQQKRLEVLQARRLKALKRDEIFKSLSEHQLTSDQLLHYKSSTSLGQMDKKRKLGEGVGHEVEDDMLSTDVNLKGKKRKKKRNDDVDISEGLPLVEKAVEDSDSEDEEEEEEEEKIKEEHDVEEEKEKMNKNVEGEKEEPEVVDDDDDEEEDEEEDIEISTGQTVNENINKNDENDDQVLPETTKPSDTKAPSAEKTGENRLKTTTTTTTSSKPVKPIYVTVNRKDDIQASRLLLPILAEEQVVMETISENDVIIICGSTGSGKTTQVPQFLYEAGYGMHESRSGIIGVTEPRRVAAMSMSKRVAEEMNLPQSVVSYQIRFEGNVTEKTKVKFMTDGVLLKEMETDFLLTKYSVIIIDEAHERSVYTDILIGMLTRIVPLRKKKGNPLKLIVMSATLKIEEFTENKLLFQNPPPVLKIDSRQYPVTIHFNRKTHDDYVSEAFKKVSKIHQKFKVDGGILVFLTGQREVQGLCSKLRKTFPRKTHHADADAGGGDVDTNTTGLIPKIDLDKYSNLANDSSLDLHSDNEAEGYSSGEDETCEMDEKSDEGFTVPTDYAPLYVLPLYSLLPTKQQEKVFQSVPEGHRLCVIATNVAETSLTIPNIKYIIDSGKVKTKFFDKLTGVSTFRIAWTSKASSNQRAGRAGRVGPGHCYRLFSSAVFENSFEEYSEPEIRRRPVDDLVLMMKNMCIHKVRNFPFPSAPDASALEAAEELLLQLGALKNTKTKQGQQLATISSLGKTLAEIPISPRFAKMIYLGGKKKCAPYIIAIAAALTVRDIFSNDIDVSQFEEAAEGEEDVDGKQKKMMITKARRKWAGDGPLSALGDVMVVLRAVGAFEYANCSPQFCENNGLRLKAMMELRKLRIQLTKALDGVMDTDYKSVDMKINPPTLDEAVTIRQIILSCSADHVARKIPPEQAKSLGVRNAYQCCLTDDPVYIHPTSSLFTKLPEYVVYHEMTETSRLYMKTLFTVDEGWLPVYAPHKCHLGKPLDEPCPKLDDESGDVQCYMTSTFGHHTWPLPPQLLPYPECPEKYRLFAKFFLDGAVCTDMAGFASQLVTPSLVMLKTWSHLQQKTEGLLVCLMEKHVCSRNKLKAEWKKNPQFCLAPYLKWLPESVHATVREMWPPNV